MQWLVQCLLRGLERGLSQGLGLPLPSGEPLPKGSDERQVMSDECFGQFGRHEAN
jgi:hypothetical protein